MSSWLEELEARLEQQLEGARKGIKPPRGTSLVQQEN